MIVVAKMYFGITGHGENVAHELNNKDNWYFTAQLKWHVN